MNPELRQTFQHFTRNLETANEVAQENIYSFAQFYIDPCIGSIKSCVYDCTAPCFPDREDQLRRRRVRARRRAEYDFDFYDDWEEEEVGASDALGWGNDELDRLLAGRGAVQPGRQRAMSYGTRRRREDIDSDPNIIPQSSRFGFLERWPFRFGASGIKYTPNAANLEENPGGLRIRDVESAEPLLPEHEQPLFRKGHSRQRSGTEASHSTMTSHSSRGDLIMSDEEEDAVPLDDEFATAMLSRRTTNTGFLEEQGNGKGRRSNTSRISSRTVSSRSFRNIESPRLDSKRSSKSAEMAPDGIQEPGEDHEPLTLSDLKREEEHLRQIEESAIVQKREAAQKLAESMGLKTEPKSPEPTPTSDYDDQTPLKSSNTYSVGGGYFAISSPISPTGETEPFPNLETPRSPQSPLSVRERSSDHPT